MKERLKELQERFTALNAREKLLVSLAAVTVVVALFFLLIWEPLQKGVDKRRDEVAEMQALVTELAMVRGQALASRGGVGVIQGQGRSLLSIVDQTGKETGLGAAISRMQPEGEATVRVWMEQADFAALVRWLGILDATYGVAVVDASIERETESGLVRARLGLVRGAP